MATTHLPWENSVSILWERPLGTQELTGYVWLSGSPDTMDLGANVLQRNTYGNRYSKAGQLKVVSSDPKGELGETAIWFDKNGTNSRLNRVLNTHFQNTSEACPVPPGNCWVIHYPLDDAPTTLSGFTIIRDIGLGRGNANVWTSCVANELEVSWKIGEPVMVKPTFVCLNGRPNSTVSGMLISTDTSYQQVLAQPPNIICTWNGTRFKPAGFKIKSTNNINIKHAISSKVPVGMTYGKFYAELELDVWVDDNYNSWFVPDYLSSSAPLATTGTFNATLTGITDEVGGSFDYTIHFIGKMVNMASTKPNKSGIQKVKAILYDPETSEGGYEDAGYWIKIEGENVLWQDVVGSHDLN